jgi:hypothetical protein
MILCAQVLAASHVHPFPSSRECFSKAAVSADHGLCTICLLRFHTPSAFVAAPVPKAPLLAKTIVILAVGLVPHVWLGTNIFGRAPPVSV